MATRIRESALGKDKKGTSSNSLHDKPTHQSRLSRPKDPNGKHEKPNYLKPTLSSTPTPGVSKNPVKKQVSIKVSKRPNLTRATSLDNKAPLSPNHLLRSSSCSIKNSAVIKPVQDKSLKSPRGGEKHRPLYARSLSASQKSGTASKNHDSGPPERVIIPDIPEVLQIETVKDEQKISAVEAQEVTINTVKSHKDDELVEYSTVAETEERNESIMNTNVSIADSPKVEGEEKEGEGSRASEKREEVTTNVGESERLGPKGAKEEEVVNEVKQETQSSASQMKKSSAVSNDVIEETATKLREQRKNKVKALAGAFETVITLQEPK